MNIIHRGYARHLAILMLLIGCVSTATLASYPVQTGVSITGGGATLTVANSGTNVGTVEIDYGADRYLIDAAFSESVSNILTGHYWAWNAGTDSRWSTTVVKTGSTIAVTGSCPTFSVTRNIYWNGDKFAMNDSIQNKTTANIAVETYYWTIMAAMVTTNKSCIAGLPFNVNNYSYTHQVMGCGPNPTIFMQQANSSLGFLVEDDFYRQAMFLTQSQDGNQSGDTAYNVTTMVNQNFGLAGNAGYTFRFSLYPGGAGHDYWKFINTVRNDWGVNNITCKGLISGDDDYTTGGRMFQSVILNPWFDFDDGAGVTWPTFASDECTCVNYVMSTVNGAASTDPASLCKTPRFMCKIETNSVPVDNTTFTNGNTLPNGSTSHYWLLPLTAAQTSTLNNNSTFAHQWADSVLWSSTTKTTQIIETDYIGPNGETWPTPGSVDPNPAHWFDLQVYQAAKPSTWAVNGTNWQNYALTDFNFQTQYMKSQIDYTLSNCLTTVPANCSKAVYIDSFTLTTDLVDNASSYPGFVWTQRWDGGQWDGNTVLMNTTSTGLITQLLTDCTLVGIPARAYLMNYVLNTKGVGLLTNGHPVDAETRVFPCESFEETQWDAIPNLTALKNLVSGGGEPWGVETMAAGHLSSPLSDGIWMSDSQYTETGSDVGYMTNNYAAIQNKYVILCLRNGQLCEPYTNYVPSTGTGSGGYGILNLMYPITPVELHEGYIIGKEKILAAVSGTFYWNKKYHPIKPSVCKTFDVYGNANTPKGFSVSSNGAQWVVNLKLRSDWNGTAIIY